MGINRSPWLWGARKTAAGMTNRTSNGIQIYQGKRAPGQSNPSSKYTDSQLASALIWPYFRLGVGVIESQYTTVPNGQYAANQFFAKTYKEAVTFVSPGNVTINETLIKFSRGLMSPTPIISVVADDSANDITITTSLLPSDATQELTDYLTAIIHNTTNNQWYTLQGYNQRASIIAPITLPASFMTTGDELNVWVSAYADPFAPNAGTSSTDVYEATVVVA